MYTFFDPIDVIPNQKEISYEVESILQMNFNGHVVPRSWYKSITFENNKVDLVSISLLAEIVHCYKYTLVTDGMQTSKKLLAEHFNFTERQVQDSLARLEKLGLIYRDYRKTITPYDNVCANVLFILINPHRIKEITFGGCQ